MELCDEQAKKTLKGSEYCWISERQNMQKPKHQTTTRNIQNALAAVDCAAATATNETVEMNYIGM